MESDDFINEAKFCNRPMAQKGDEKSFKGYPFMPLL
jgi:hypothetical protein